VCDTSESSVKDDISIPSATVLSPSPVHVHGTIFQ